MARPSKYDWDAIKEAYEGGLDKADIIKKYHIDNKQLGNKVRDDGWVIKGHLKADIEGFYAKTAQMAQNIDKLHQSNQDLVIQKINTLEADNELMGNNRKIAKMLQGIIVANRNSINLQNIRNVSGTIKDIESIANPPKQDINLTNAQQNNENTQIVFKRIGSNE